MTGDFAIKQNDMVENFAKQLDEICEMTGNINTSDDEDIPFGYEQLPQEDDENNEGSSTTDSHSGGVDHYGSAENLHYDRCRQESSNNIVCNEGDHTDTNLTDVAPLMISLDPKESIPQETSALIMDIMKKYQLPEHAIPGWAKHIPESSWLPKMDNNMSKSD